MQTFCGHAYNILKVAIHVKEYLTGLPVQLNFTDKPERVYCTTVQATEKIWI